MDLVIPTSNILFLSPSLFLVLFLKGSDSECGSSGPTNVHVWPRVQHEI